MASSIQRVGFMVWASLPWWLWDQTVAAVAARIRASASRASSFVS
jgi:hypothetical protein